MGPMPVAPGPPGMAPAWPRPRPRLSTGDVLEIAVQDYFFLARCKDDWCAQEMFSALIMERWFRDHPPRSRRERLTQRHLTAALIPLALLAALIRAVLCALSPEPVQPGYPGRADAPVLRVPSAPLVRAHAILTAAPPASRAPVPAGATA